MLKDLSVIAPCFNEEKNVTELTERITTVFSTHNLNAELILINDGSSDQTASMIDTLAKRFPDYVRAFHHTHNQGIEQGWKTGVTHSSGYYICLIDSDLQNQPEDIARLYDTIERGNADLVQGVRQHIGPQKDSRYFLSKTLNYLLNSLFSMTSRDNKSGFIMCPKSILSELLAHRFHYHYFQTFITVSAHKKNYRIKEIDTVFESRLLGSSFIKPIPILLICRVLKDLAKGYIEYNVLKTRETQLHNFLKTKHLQKQPHKMTVIRKLWFKAYCLLMPLHHWMIGRSAGHYFQELNQTQWLSAADINELQNRKLSSLIYHAYHHVDYYRTIMQKRGLKPSDIQSLDTLSKLPLLHKTDVKQHLYSSLLSDNHIKKHIQKITTSGSTGSPFQCFVDKYQLEMRWAATLRGMEMTGYKFGDKTLRLWHQTLGLSLGQIIKEKLDAWFTRRTFIPVFEITESNIKRMILLIKRIKPQLIDGYAEVLNLLATYFKTHPNNAIHIPYVISSAQSLEASQRRIIEKELNSTVYDKYGSREFSGIAYECNTHLGHHIVAENYIVEILKEGRPALPGEIGEIVITDLNNKCMPFIRYRIGDLAVAMDNNQPCSCGRGLPRIGTIEGRTQSIIVCNNGTYLPGTFFSHFFKDYDFMIKQYQVLQTEYEKINLTIVKAARFDETQFTQCIHQLKHYIGHKTHLTIQFVAHIPLQKTGKHHSVLSTLPIDFQNNVSLFHM